jgi:hypothetical protein
MGENRVLSLLGYVALGAAGFMGVYAAFIRPWHQRWGARDAEAAAPMAGDDLIESPNWTATRAVSIHAPPAAVWPWLVQMGYQRGGLYTYDWLDQLAGLLDRPSADSVLPQFQDLAPGDVIPIRDDPGWSVAALERERLLVLDIRRPRVHITWSFLLTPEVGGGARLVLRYRGFLQPRFLELPFYAFLDGAEFLMTRKMLLGIKSRAERLAAAKWDS